MIPIKDRGDLFQKRIPELKRAAPPDAAPTPSFVPSTAKLPAQWEHGIPFNAKSVGIPFAPL